MFASNELTRNARSRWCAAIGLLVVTSYTLPFMRALEITQWGFLIEICSETSTHSGSGAIDGDRDTDTV
jgi:hypothetical protein